MQLFTKKTDDIYEKLQKYVKERDNTENYEKELKQLYPEIKNICFLAQFCIENNIDIGQLSYSRKKDFFHKTNTKNSFGFFFNSKECRKIIGIGYGDNKIFDPTLFKGYTLISSNNDEQKFFSNDENQITNLKTFKRDFNSFKKSFYNCLKEINL